jgi:non-homologous end joining protein Ku
MDTMKKLIIAGMLTSLCACATTEKTQPEATAGLAPDSVTLGGVTNEDATKKLYEALVKNNYLAKMSGAHSVAVQFDDNQFLLQPSINPDGIDRILMNRFYAVHPKLVGSKDLLVLIGTLNHKLNFAKFVLRENGAVIQVQDAATFVDTIEIEEIRRFMLWTDEGLRQVSHSLPKGAEEMIKPIPIMK